MFVRNCLIIGCFLCFLASCAASKRISEKGLKFIKLGDPMPAEGLKRYKGHAVRDTTYDEGGYRWRAVIMDYKDGEVYIEEDFLGEKKVNRIRVESAKLSVNKEIVVGMSFGELKTRANDWDIIYLYSYGLLDVTSVSSYHIHYLIKDEKTPAKQYEKEKIEPDDINDDAKVIGIVIM